MAADEKEPSSRMATFLRLGVLAGVVIIGLVGGYVVQRVVTASGQTAQVEEDEESAGNREYQYYDLEPITVTLNTRQKDRYLRATITLAIRKRVFQAASTTLDKRKPLLKDRLITYLSSLALDDVGDSGRLNKIRREILDSLNNELWPDEKPQIDHLLFKEFALQ